MDIGCVNINLHDINALDIKWINLKGELSMKKKKRNTPYYERWWIPTAISIIALIVSIIKIFLYGMS